MRRAIGPGASLVWTVAATLAVAALCGAEPIADTCRRARVRLTGRVVCSLDCRAVRQHGPARWTRRRRTSAPVDRALRRWPDGAGRHRMARGRSLDAVRRRADRAHPHRPRRAARRHAIPRHQRTGSRPAANRACSGLAFLPDRRADVSSSTTPTPRAHRSSPRTTPMTATATRRTRTARRSGCVWPTGSATTTADRLAFGPDGLPVHRTGRRRWRRRPAGFRPAPRHAPRQGPAHRRLRRTCRQRSALRDPARQPVRRSVGARPEIWLTGLRNPWRIRFDRATGDLWIGDVGQGEREEIDVRVPGSAASTSAGTSWRAPPASATAATECATPELTLPVTEYVHDWAAR